MNQFSRKIKKTSFTNDVLKLLSGTVLSQILIILSTPFITRLYAPEAFGLSAIFGSTTGIIVSVSSLLYERSIIVAKTDEEAANQLVISLGFVLLIGGLVVPMIWIFGNDFIDFLNSPTLVKYVWILPISVIMNGFFHALNYWFTRRKKFSSLSSAKVINSVLIISIQLGFGFYGYLSEATLIWAKIIGVTVSTSILVWQVWNDDNLLAFNNISLKTIISGIKRYRKFPLYSTGGTLLNKVSQQLPTFILSAFFSSNVVGYYALSTRIIGLPMSFIGGSIGQVFFQRAAQAKLDGNLQNLTESTLKKLAYIGIFPLILVAFFGNDIFTIILGDKWSESGIYSQILSLGMLFGFISSSLSTIFSVLEKQEVILKVQIAKFITRLIALTIGGFLNDIFITLILFSSVNILTQGYQCVVGIRFSGMSITKAIKIFLMWTFISITICFLGLIFKEFVLDI